MNQIRSIQTLNKRELEAGIHNPNASWHVDYRDTAFINFGGLPFNLSEGDILTIFSQYGEPVFLKLARDKETGKSRGFGWLKYEDQRSTDLAVDNLGGAEIGGRLVRVDHARYKMRDDEDADEFRVGWEDVRRRERKEKGEKSESEVEEINEEPEVRRPMIKEEKELAKLIAEHDEDDPMKAFLIEEKKKEVEVALRKGEKGERKHRHRHHHDRHRSHRVKGDESAGEDDHGKERRKKSRRDQTPVVDDRQRRDEAPKAKGRDSRRRDESDDSEPFRARDRRSDRDDQGRRLDHRRDRGRDERDGDHRNRRRSRSRSPRSHRDR